MFALKPSDPIWRGETAPVESSEKKRERERSLGTILITEVMTFLLLIRKIFKRLSQISFLSPYLNIR